MKTIFTYKSFLLNKALFIPVCFLFNCSLAQTDSNLTSQDAIYNRPFIQIPKTKSSVGGYVEGNTNYFMEDGVTEGFSMELRRFNFFLYSNLHDKIKFLSEVEFEHGTEEIALETALLDIELNPSLNFRAGILLPNIGVVNVNHDSPKWEFIERPLSSTEIIPTTLSEVGFGLHGKFFPGSSILSYDAYLTNGIQDGIVLNSTGKTHLGSGKNPHMFGEDNNGVPMYNAKASLSNRHWGEAGVSYYGGIYNTFQKDGLIIDKKKNVSLFAVDVRSEIKKIKITGEIAFVTIEIDSSLKNSYATRQLGGFLELSYPILKRTIAGFNHSIIHASIRLEKIDYNAGTLPDGSPIGDEIHALSLGLGWRLTESTLIRANYRHHTLFDFFNNPPALKAGFQVGIASYF
jgi:hypothetical protein